MKSVFQGKNVAVSSTLRGIFSVPKSFRKIPFESIKKDILGDSYDLSVVLIGRKLSRTLNRLHRQKDYPTDVLSFSLSKKEGGIFITPAIAKIKSKKFDREFLGDKYFENYLLLLFIHACLHLKGMGHGSTMDKYEFSYYNRYRHWNV